jgi:hypothetical protein
MPLNHAKAIDRARSWERGVWGFVMSDRGQWTKTKAAWIPAVLLLAGCGQDAPPYDDLPLRDALRATPEVVAGLSFETRHELAERLDAAGRNDDGTMTFGLPETVTIDTLARVADEAREDQEQDALIVGEIVAQPSDFSLRSENIDEETLGRVVVGPIFLRGRPGAQTVPLEDVALRGRAGKWLRELSGRAHTKQMVRTTGLPLGAWAFEDTLYVNASWLVAMAALEEDVIVPGPVNGSTVTIDAPSKKPLTVEYNPYKLPVSIEECAGQVTQTCQCGTSCTHDVTDPSFPNAVDECAWVNQDPSHASVLCVLALMSIGDVSSCMASGAPQCAAVTTGEDALAFVQNANCMSLLDVCLRDGYIPQPSSGSGGGSCGEVDCGSCSNCGNGCSDSNNSCSKCNDDCSSCNDNWSDCNDNCSNSGQNCSNTGSNANSCSKCSVKPASERSPLPAPLGSTFWLVAPAAYLLLRGRRRS